jgi:hypothetical protein
LSAVSSGKLERFSMKRRNVLGQTPLGFCDTDRQSSSVFPGLAGGAESTLPRGPDTTRAPARETSGLFHRQYRIVELLSDDSPKDA